MRRGSAWDSRPSATGPSEQSNEPLLRRCWDCCSRWWLSWPTTKRDDSQATCGGRAAWYDKPHRTFFSDALALVRKELWAQETFYGSPQQDDTVKVSREFVERLTDVVCYAA